MEENKIIETAEAQVEEQVVEETGKILFADEVIATIAALAANDVEGIASMSGNVVSGLFGKKNITKGVKVAVNGDSVTVEASVNVKYGFAIQNVCRNLQEAMKNGIETMTGLNVTSVNVNVVSVVFEKPAQEEPVAEIAAPVEE